MTPKRAEATCLILLPAPRPSATRQEAGLLLAAFPGVAAAAQEVHGRGQGLVGLPADGAEGHGRGDEALQDRLFRLHLVDGHRGARPDAQQRAQGARVGPVAVDRGRVLAERRVVPLPHRALQQGDGLGGEQVPLPAAPLVVQAAGRQGELGVRVARVLGSGREPRLVQRPFLPLHLLQADAADARGGAGEGQLQQLGPDAQGLEALRAPVAAQGGDAHLGHDLGQALLDGRDVVLRGLLGGELGVQVSALLQVADGVEGQVGIDPAGPEADQAGEVVHLAGLAGLDHQRAEVPLAAPDQVVVDAADGQQSGDGRPLGPRAAVAQDDQGGPLVDPALGLQAGLGQGPAQLPPAPGQREQDRHRAHREILEPGLAQLLEVVVGEDGVRELELAAVLRGLVQEVALPAHEAHQGHDQALAVGVDGRVGHLGEQLAEVVEQQPGAGREDRGRGVVAHGADGLLGVLRHGRDDAEQVLPGVAEAALQGGQPLPVEGHGPGGAEQALQHDAVLLQPVPVGLSPGNGGLDLVVAEDPALGRVHQQHAPGGQAPLFQDFRRVDVQHADLRGQQDRAPAGDQVAGRAQAVAVQQGAHQAPVAEGHGRRAVPRLHDRGVVLVEGPLVLGDVVPGAEGLGHHHDHGVRQRAAAQDQQLQHVVEGRRVAAARLDDGQQPGQVLPEQGGGQAGLPGAHVVHVAPQGVDLAVVGRQAERLGQEPGREGVGAVALVHDGQAAPEILRAQVRVERHELRGHEHALVHDGPAREGGDVEALRSPARAEGLLLQGPAQDVQPSLGRLSRLGARPRGEEQLPEGGHLPAGLLTQAVGVDRHPPPGQEAGPFLPHRPFHQGAGAVRLAFLGRQEEEARGVEARRRERRARDPPEEFVGKLQEHARAVAGLQVAAHGASVLQVDQDAHRVLHDPVGLSAPEVGDEAHAAGVVFVAGVVEAERFVHNNKNYVWICNLAGFVKYPQPAWAKRRERLPGSGRRIPGPRSSAAARSRSPRWPAPTSRRPGPPARCAPRPAAAAGAPRRSVPAG